MKKHINKIFAGILALLLLTVALDTKLAQPEAPGTTNDKFIGFFLAYEKMPPRICVVLDHTARSFSWHDFGQRRGCTP